MSYTFTSLFAVTDQIQSTVDQAGGIFRRITDTFLSARSIVTLLIALLLALILGRAIAYALRRLTDIVSVAIDRTDNLATVTRLRRIETLIVLSIAVIRAILVILAFYVWWQLQSASSGNAPQAGTLLGASAITALLVTGAISPVLRDLAYGAVMMAEHWYGVGDHIKIDPLDNAQGVVERVTLRSTRIRGINGEIVWVNNQNIWGVHVTPKGVRTIALELFVRDLEKGIKLIEDTNVRLPIGASVVTSPLSIMTQAQVGKELWHITAISEIAPGRDWLLDTFAVNVLQELDADQQVLVHEPITRYADTDAERRFARTIHNSRKRRIRRQNVVRKVTKQRLQRSPNDYRPGKHDND